jgi:hypothetical protein
MPGPSAPPHEEPTIRIPRHYAPDGFLCLRNRGRPMTPTRATCSLCGGIVILAVTARRPPP